METLKISDDSTVDTIINSVKSNFIEKNRKYALLEFQQDISRINCEKIVESIKNYFDIFIVLKTGIPKNIAKIEEYFSYGVHGVYFFDEAQNSIRKQLDKIFYATEIFPEGLIFANAGKSKKLIGKMLSKHVIPVVSSCNQELIEFIKNHKNFSTLSSQYLKYIAVFEENACNFSIVENIKLKMKLESLNLRKKLMVKGAEESLYSSGL